MTLVQPVGLHLFNVPLERQDFVWDMTAMKGSYVMKTQWMSGYLTISAKYFQPVLLLSHSCLLQVKYFSLFKCSMTNLKAA